MQFSDPVMRDHIFAQLTDKELRGERLTPEEDRLKGEILRSIEIETERRRVEGCEVCGSLQHRWQRCPGLLPF